MPLEPFVSNLRVFEGQMRLVGNDFGLAVILLILQLALNLRGEVEDPLTLSWGRIKHDLNFDVNSTQGINNRFVNLCLSYSQLFNAYILGDLKLAHQASKVTGFERVMGNHFCNTIHAFYDGMLYLALCRQTKRQHYRRIATRVVRRLSSLAKSRPVNVVPLLSLLQAEEASLLSTSEVIRRNKVIKLYDLSIKQLVRGGFVHYAAIANERAAEYVANACGDRERELEYLQRAHALYLEWGALAKTRAMELKYPGILLSPSKTRPC